MDDTNIMYIYSSMYIEICNNHTILQGLQPIQITVTIIVNRIVYIFRALYLINSYMK